MIRRSIPWTIQPPIGVGPNKKWIDRGLVALFDCRQARELISGDFATNRTSLIAPSTRGIAADFSGSANQQYAHRPAYAVLGPITIAALCDIDALTNYSPIITKMGTTTTNVPYELRVGAAAKDSFINFARANTSVRDRRGASNRLTVPFKGLIAVTAPSGLIESAATLYVNNVPTVLSSNASGTGLGTDNGSTVWIGRRYDGATQLDGRIYYVPLFNAELSGAYLKELYDNPWDIYEPQQRNIYVSVAGGGLNVTGLLGTADATGLTANVDKQLAITATLTTATASGLTAQVDTQAAITATLATATADGITANVDKQLAIAGTLATATASGITAGVDTQLAIAGSLATATASGLTANVDIQTAIAGALATATADGITATIDQQLAITATLATATADGITATISNGLTIAATLATATAAGFNANIDQQIAISGSLATAIADGIIASISFGNDLNISASIGTATASGLTAGVDSQTAVTTTLGQASADGFSASVTLASSWTGEPFNFSSPITRTFDFTSSITKNLNFESPI